MSLAPSQPTNVSVEVLTSTEISISWVPPEIPNGNISFYRVYYNSSSINKKIVIRDELSTNITNLQKFTRYIFSVTAVNLIENKELEGPKSESIQIKTLEDGKHVNNDIFVLSLHLLIVCVLPAPSAPLDVSVELVSNDPSRLTVKWKPPALSNGNIRKYKIFYQDSSKKDNKTLQQLTVNATSRTAEIRGLIVFTKYTVQVYPLLSVHH